MLCETLQQAVRLHFKAKTDGNDFINILFMQSIQQHMQDTVRNAGLILRSVL